MTSKDRKSILFSGLVNGLIWSVILTIGVYTFKDVFRPYLIIVWFLFFFLTGGFKKWYSLKKQKD